MQQDVRSALTQAHALFGAGRMDPAGRLCVQVLERVPGEPNALHLLGLIHHHQGDLAQALELVERACQVPGAPAPWFSNLAELLRVKGQYAEGERMARRALEGDVGLATAWGNLGLILQQTGTVDGARLAEAVACYDRAVALDPGLAIAYFNRGTLLLSHGDLARGWPDYEWRKQTRTYTAAPRKFAEAPWLGGQDISGKTLLVHWEQGLGDTIQFCRYLRTLNGLGARVLFAPQKQLTGLMRGLAADFELVDIQGPDLRFDYHVPLLSLPLALGTTLETIPDGVPYLDADRDSTSFWRRHVEEGGFRIGICWQGAPGAWDAGRSFSIDEFQAIARIPGVRLYNLHKGAGLSQLDHLAPDMSVETFAGRLDAGPDAFVDTAAVMKLCDLVITSDTATAHLAGALGVPTWVALKHVPEWRWMLVRSDSPWYPTVRLFRQPAYGDWKGVFLEMEKALRTLLNGTATRPRGEAALPRSPQVVASWGEILDKLTILEIKSARIQDAAALANVRRELELLSETAGAPLARIPDLLPLKARLRAVNEELWGIEDRIRAKEQRQAFDDEFILLARSVYRTNDERSRIKREINRLLDSEVVEEKQYSSY